MAQYLLLPRISVRRANALSGQHLHGFPPMTAFMGFMWALERKWNTFHPQRSYVRFTEVGVIAHNHREHVVPLNEERGTGFAAFLWDKYSVLPASKGRTVNAPFSPAAFIDISVSIIIRLEWRDADHADTSIMSSEDMYGVAGMVERMRVAGGRIDAIDRVHDMPVCFEATETDTSEFRRQMLRLGYGNALISRNDIIRKRQDQLADAWRIIQAANPGQEVSYASSFNNLPVYDDVDDGSGPDDVRRYLRLQPNSMFSETPGVLDAIISMNFSLGRAGSGAYPDNEVEKCGVDGKYPEKCAHVWSHRLFLPDEARTILENRPKGWFSPVVVGYSSIGHVQKPGLPGARDDCTPLQAVESIIGMGEWISIGRVMSGDVGNIMWKPVTTIDPDTSQEILFLCENGASAISEELELCED